MNRYKDQITNACGVVIAVGGAVLASGLDLGPVVTTIAKVAVAVAGAIIGYFTGKVHNA